MADDLDKKRKEAEAAFAEIPEKFGITQTTDPKTGKTGYNLEAFARTFARSAPGNRREAEYSVGAFLAKEELFDPANKDKDTVITKEEFIDAWLKPEPKRAEDSKTIRAENDFYDLAGQARVPLTRDSKTGEMGYSVQALSDAYDKKLEGETKRWLFAMSEAEAREKGAAFKQALDSMNTDHDSVLSKAESVTATLAPPQTPTAPKTTTPSRPK